MNDKTGPKIALGFVVFSKQLPPLLIKICNQACYFLFMTVRNRVTKVCENVRAGEENVWRVEVPSVLQRLENLACALCCGSPSHHTLQL